MIPHAIITDIEAKLSAYDGIGDHILAEANGSALCMGGMQVDRTIKFTIDNEYNYRVEITDIMVATGTQSLKVGRRFDHPVTAMNLFNECIDTLNNFNG